MGKRAAKDSCNKPGFKKRKFTNVSKLIDPFSSGIYATCARRKEKQARQELMSILLDKLPQYFNLEDLHADADSNGGNDTRDLSIEEKIERELQELKDSETNTKNNLLQPIDLDCECVIFIKTKKPISPEVLVQKLVRDCYDSGVKTTRYTQKLIPISDSCTATGEEPREQLRQLAKRVLRDHFHKEKDQKPIKFAIQVGKKNFNAMESEEMIKVIAECVGREHGHSVDLKNYDKLILVECYKNNIGIGVVDDYLKYSKFNLQQIFDKSIARATLGSEAS
ncbi:hypothetical protein KGF56_000623 [Candida oxycetoniae]|uniref:THUMP domain-containing protein n=1 Tax=Candida oxycetoniae TaxID=497107 RepID=A0AAI9WZK1_9ASCO|nr:uncharacterized protein KGF56_000623 [Candida oxycetoniae]KAI3406491.1 hypothetical protein KGF56_000623 [Candida oxycetoniae]